MTRRVSVIVPTYNTGAPLQRLVDSLDAQTLPTDAFEAVFVDDGSTDDTAERLEQLCAARPNYRTTRIPNSGWPGRPRNVGLDLAEGEYVFFCDHDDYLAPDALEKLHAYATENSSDVVIGREVRVGRQPLSNTIFATNQAKVDLSWPPLLGLLTPHKLFRRAFLDEHGLRFPEGKRRLEDHVFVVSAYFKATTISVLGETPVYYWVMKATEGTTHASKGVDPETYFPHLVEVLDLVEANTEPGPLREQMLASWYRGKVLGFIARSIRSWEPERRDALLRIAAELARTRFAHSDPYLNPIKRAQSVLLRAGRTDDVITIGSYLEGLTSTPQVRSAAWQDGQLVVEFTTTLRDRTGAPVLFRRDGDKVVWSPALGEGVEAPEIDVTAAVMSPVAVVRLRESRTGLHHELTGSVVADLEQVEGGLSLSTTTTVRIDPLSVSQGHALYAGNWRARVWIGLGGLDTLDDLTVAGSPPGPALLDGLSVVPFAARRSPILVLAVASADRPLAGAVTPHPEDVSITDTVGGSRLTISLPGVHVRGDVRLPAALSIGGLPVAAEVVAEGGALRVESWLSALPGLAPLALALGDDKPTALPLALHVGGDGRVTPKTRVPAGKKKKAPAKPPSHPGLRKAVRQVPGLAPALRRLRPTVAKARTKARATAEQIREKRS